MKQLKLLFTVLFLSVLGLGNMKAADKITDYANIVSGKKYLIGATTGKTPADYYLKVNGSTASSTAVAGTAVSSASDATVFVFEGSNTSWTIKFDGTSNYLSLPSSKNNGKVLVSSSSATFTLSNQNGTIRLTIGSYSVQKNNSGAQFGSYGNTQTDVWLEEVSSGSTEPTVSLSATSIDFGSKEQGATVEAQDVTVTLTNTDSATATLSGTNAREFEIVAGEKLTQTGVVSVRPTAAALAAVGTYTASLDVVAKGVNGTKSVALSLAVTAPFDGIVGKIVPTNFTTKSYADNNGSHVIDDMQLYSNQTYQSSSLIQMQKTSGYIYNEVTLGQIAKIEIAYTANNFKVYEGDDTESMNEVNNPSNSNNTLTYTLSNKGFFKVAANSSAAATASSIKIYYTPVKSTITLATCENGSVGVDGIADLTQVKAGTVVTLTNTPANGYKLAAYSVVDAESNPVTVTDGKFTMPAYDVTISATFEVAKVFSGSDLTLSGEYPTKFWKGDAFSHEGMTVTAHFNTGDETVTGVFSGYDMATPGVQTVTVTFTEGDASQTATYNIEVKTIANTQETAYTPTQAKVLYDAGKDLDTKVYVKGIVSEMASTSLPQAGGYLNFYISEDGQKSSLQFECYKTYKATGYVKWISLDEVQVGDEVVAYGKLAYYASGDVYEFDGNTESYVVSLNRPVVLTSITLNTDNVKKTYKIGTDDVFSAEGLVVTAHYNVATNDKTIDLADVTFSGYNMAVANTYDVTVSYTENEVTKTATYEIQVKPNCDNLATITTGATEHGTFDLSVKGEQCAETAISTVLTAEPAEHYHLASVTATNGTVGAIEGNTCTITDITENAEITAVFEEDAKGTATFVKGNEAATGDAPAAIVKYVGETLTIPANTFALAGGYKFAGWKYNETIYQKGDEFTVTGDAEFVAQWEALPIWATTYTSNVTLTAQSDTKCNKEIVKVNDEETEYDALKMGTSSAAGSCTVTVPLGTTKLHFHAILWKGTSGSLVVKQSETELFNQAIAANIGLANSSPYTLTGNPTDDYYCINFGSALTEATTLTFSCTNKRFAIYGVNVEKVDVELLSIAVSGIPTTTEYYDGQAFDPAGLVVTGTYNIGEPQEITEGIDWTFDPATLATGATSVTVTATVGDKVSAPFVVNGLTVSDPSSLGDAVIIVFPYNDSYYAMASDLTPVEVHMVNGKVVGVVEADRASLTWYKKEAEGMTTFQNMGGDYLIGGSNTTLSVGSTAYSWNWNATDKYYWKKDGSSERTFLYNNSGAIKNYASSNAGNSGYSTYPIFATEFVDGEFDSRDLSYGMGTHCYPYTIKAGEYQGASFYIPAYRLGTSKLYWDEVAADEDIEAGKPYLVVPDLDSEEVIFVKQTETVNAPAVVDYGMVGNFDAPYMMVPAYENNYIVLDNQFRLAGNNVAIGQYRAYIHLEDVTDHAVAPAPGRRRIEMNNADATVATGIENLNGENMHGEPMKVLINGQVFILRGAKMYNAQGQLVK